MPPVGEREWRDEKDEFDAAAETRRTNLIQTQEIEKEKFLREPEILLQKLIPAEGTARVRQHRLVFRESDRAQRFRLQREGRRLRARPRVAHQDLHAIVAKNFV